MTDDRHPKMAVRGYPSAAEADRHDLEFWLQIPERERILRVWQLSQELWRLRGELRIEILTELTGLTFTEAWADRLRKPFGDVEVDFIGRAAFIHNRYATGGRRISATSKGWNEPDPW